MDEPRTLQTPRDNIYRWHPRVTPFWLFCVITTTGTGIGKAILVSKGDAIGSTTMEWVAGVLLALSIQFLNNLEAFHHYNAYARIFFSQDCLAPLWKILPRPFYLDDEDLPEWLTRHRHQDLRHGEILVTPYRLLVSIVTTVFGLAKMILTYTGHPGAMSSLDWAFSVPTVLILYCISLYENNTVNFAPTFFKADYSDVVFNGTFWVLYVILCSGSVLLFSTWSTFCVSNILKFVPFAVNLLLPPPEESSKTLVCKILSWSSSAFSISTLVLISGFGLMFALLGALPLVSTNVFFWDENRRAGRTITAGFRYLGGLQLGSFIVKYLSRGLTTCLYS